jgi:hypothetical protein
LIGTVPTLQQHFHTGQPTPTRHVCPFCHQGHLEQDCDCPSLCSKLTCRHRYTNWDGTWCPLNYTEGYRKQAVPVFKVQGGQAA